MKFVLIAHGLAGLTLASPSTINPGLLKKLGDGFEGNGTATIMIAFKDTNLHSVRQQVNSATYSTRGAKITDLRDRLERHSLKNGGKVLDHVKKARTGAQKVEHIWATNEIVVRNADLALVQSLAQFSEISEVRETSILPLPDILNMMPYTGPVRGMQWGVAAVGADRAWSLGYDGTGVTVGIIDTGCRFEHEALIGGRRSEYSWFDPGELSVDPSDDVGHGTHVLGTVAGRTNGVGVAPGAQWVACKGCKPDGCSEADLKLCGQWMLCPTKPDKTSPDCSKVPAVVSNSWARGNEDPFYDDILAAWHEAQIVPVFAIGNDGPLCRRAHSPGDSAFAIGVGAIDADNRTASFSSRGPTTETGRIKPDLAGPGSDVTSSCFDSVTSYCTMSGTSMATPHIAGIVALMRQVDPTLTVNKTKEILFDSAVASPSLLKLCGWSNEPKYHDNHVGYGLPQCVTVVQAVKKNMAEK